MEKGLVDCTLVSRNPRTQSKFNMLVGSSTVLIIADSDDNPELWIPTKEECADIEVDNEELKNYISRHWCQDIEDLDPEELLEAKWKTIKKACFPEPRLWDNLSFAPEEGQRLVDRFRDSGLQIIVKMASIELTPDKPDFSEGGWHIEGQMNEHIAGTVLYYLDSENITTSSLSFRMQTYSHMNGDWGAGPSYNVGQDNYSWMEAAFGASLSGGECLQNFGTIETRPGRLLAFPNVL